MKTDVRDFSENVLKNSKTWLQYVDADGICNRCGEHTSLLEPCCSTSVSYEGGSENAEDLWDQIEEEVTQFLGPRGEI